MRVAYDQNGYSYDVDTGFYLTLYYDEQGFAYDSATGEPVEEVIVADAMGGTIYTGGGGIDWNQVIFTAAQAYAAGQGAAQSGRYIPTGSPAPGPVTTLPGSGAGATVTGGVTPGGISGGLNISTNTLMLIVGGFLLFMLGSSKGRR